MCLFNAMLVAGIEPDLCKLCIKGKHHQQQASNLAQNRNIFDMSDKAFLLVFECVYIYRHSNYAQTIFVTPWPI